MFLISPSARYFYDPDAVRQGATYGYCENEGGGDLWTPAGSAGKKRPRRASRTSTAKVTEGATRNLRTVWYFPTRPSPYAHFATFPEELPELAIRASTSEVGACAACGTPWRRVVKTSGGVVGRDSNLRPRSDGKRRYSLDSKSAHGGYRREEAGWRRGCGCETEERRPCVVLDPFAGSGTTGVVARRLGRHFVGIELSARYAAIARSRLGLEGGPDPGPLFEPRPPLSA